MTALDLFVDLRGKGVTFSIDGDQLRINASKGLITGELREALANNKRAILEIVMREHEANEHRKLLAMVEHVLPGARLRTDIPPLPPPDPDRPITVYLRYADGQFSDAPACGDEQNGARADDRRAGRGVLRHAGRRGSTTGRAPANSRASASVVT